MKELCAEHIQTSEVFLFCDDFPVALVGVFNTLLAFTAKGVYFLLDRGVFSFGVPILDRPCTGVDFVLLTRGIAGFGVPGFTGFVIIGLVLVF